MKPVDRNGTPIYSRTFAVMQATGEKLEQHGYVERRLKPNLFERDYGFVRFYADLRGTEVVPIWEDQRPLFYWYWHPDPGPPLEQRQRAVLLEWVRLSPAVELRLSFEMKMHGGAQSDDAALLDEVEIGDASPLVLEGLARWRRLEDAARSHEQWKTTRRPGEISRGIERSAMVETLIAMPVAQIHLPGATEHLVRWANQKLVRGTLVGAHVRWIFESATATAGEVYAFYQRAVVECGWSDVTGEPRTAALLGGGFGLAWEWRRCTLRLSMLNEYDRMSYGIDSRLAFEVRLDAPVLTT